jgi:hypothetical protein
VGCECPRLSQPLPRHADAVAIAGVGRQLERGRVELRPCGSRPLGGTNREGRDADGGGGDCREPHGCSSRRRAVPTHGSPHRFEPCWRPREHGLISQPAIQFGRDFDGRRIAILRPLCESCMDDRGERTR